MVTGRSRLTGSPGRRSPNALRDSVSSDRSNARVAAPSPDPPRSTTVRQTPFTATESPGPESSATFGERTTRRGPDPTTAPSSSTIPVNIPHHLDVGPHHLHRSEIQGHCVRQRGEALPSQDARRGLAPDHLRG